MVRIEEEVRVMERTGQQYKRGMLEEATIVLRMAFKEAVKPEENSK